MRPLSMPDRNHQNGAVYGRPLVPFALQYGANFRKTGRLSLERGDGTEWVRISYEAESAKTATDRHSAEPQP